MSKLASSRALGSDLKRVDAHVVKPEEYEELPEMTDEMFARTVFKKADRMAEHLARAPLPRLSSEV
ncbi:MAG: hypothetical protein VKI63_01600 [Cyanobium sp.]|nr:hypothetical protein [Cyanobium sp.]